MSITVASLWLACMTSCHASGGKSTPGSQELTADQQELLDQGWTLKAAQGEDISTSYGITPTYGQQDNYFDIKVGDGYSVAVKIINSQTNQCIRYVFVPEGTTFTVNYIPQGLYYLKLACGKDWMEHADGQRTMGQFTRDVFYEKSNTSYDFGAKNSQDFVNYILEINVKDGQAKNQVHTTTITAEEFNAN